ncbi:CHASE3 domain-containing protein, partial [Streptomyces olivaceoviridis]
MTVRRWHGSRRLGLTRLTVAASALLALLIGVAFVVLLWAIDDANDSTSARRASRTALVEAGSMEQLLVDLETGQRGFVITKRDDFLQPWQANVFNVSPRVRGSRGVAALGDGGQRAVVT